MNQHYKGALSGLSEMVKLKERGVPTSEATAMTAILTRATLAVAEEQAKTNKHLELANLIAYAQLCEGMNNSGGTYAAAREAADLAMSTANSAPEEDGF